MAPCSQAQREGDEFANSCLLYPSPASYLTSRTPDILAKRIPKGLWVPEALSSLEEGREPHLGPRTTYLTGPVLIPIFQVGKKVG